MIPIEYFTYISGFLFCIGLTITIVKKNLIVVLMGAELMLNAANINFVAFSRGDAELGGQIMTIFIMVIAAAEVTVALAIIIKLFENYKTVSINRINELKG
ncbi:NADH-quinone oxidoreductase subunit NuoK [Sediminitomix flava]|uniref:NADH-quinone oxidoreductase subunit K n=1 Tax=Sediminitomix flava TaxID=379075 RepID=A0A315Z8M3_SEDFL|nr:NADH-quinone oxidoreductase subunit NuoK [Sediminitomix flava]PWJ40040.1 NADH dehydrogenase subunit K [Sediminitomix flava]